jgi:hypothetical protein
MARVKSLIAILLALSLLVSPTTYLFADGLPGPNGGEVIDGHPWDDEAVESGPGPGDDDPNTTGESPVLVDLPTVNVPTSATSGSGAQLVAQLMRSIVGSWLRISETKVIKGKTVRRDR